MNLTPGTRKNYEARAWTSAAKRQSLLTLRVCLSIHLGFEGQAIDPICLSQSGVVGFVLSYSGVFP
jgi:hypothetical protein